MISAIPEPAPRSHPPGHQHGGRRAPHDAERAVHPRRVRASSSHARSSARATARSISSQRSFDPLPSIVIAHMLGVPPEMRGSLPRLVRRAARGAEHRRHRTRCRRRTRSSPITCRASSTSGAPSPTRPTTSSRASSTPTSTASTCRTAPIRTQTMFLIVAGNETTRNLIGNCLFVLATASRPASCSSVPIRELVMPFVEESLRLDSPVQVLGRAVLGDTEIEGCPLHAGDRVVFGLASANRDEAAHEDPTEVRLDRAAASATTSPSVPGRTCAPAHRWPGSKPPRCSTSSAPVSTPCASPTATCPTSTRSSGRTATGPSPW